MSCVPSAHVSCDTSHFADSSAGAFEARQVIGGWSASSYKGTAGLRSGSETLATVQGVHCYGCCAHATRLLSEGKKNAQGRGLE
jgi:hypothetical protein